MVLPIWGYAPKLCGLMLCVDLFAGAGGSGLGLRRLGFAPWSYERDADCVATLRAAGHQVVRCDLGAYEWDPVWRGEVGVLHGSPPCQPWSASGSGLGADDKRDGMPHMLRAVEALRPWLVTVENVEGLTYAKHRGYLTWFVGALEALGYTVAWRVLNARRSARRRSGMARSADSARHAR